MGQEGRFVGYTHMNAASSRSHVILTVTVQYRRKEGEGAGMSVQAEGMVFKGKLHIVDLAGSERLKKTGVALLMHFPPLCVRSCREGVVIVQVQRVW